DAGDLTGKLGDTLVLPEAPLLAAARVLFVGLGPAADIDRASLAKSITTAALMISRLPGQSVACLLPSLPEGKPGLNLHSATREITSSLTVGSVGPGLYQSVPRRHRFRSVTIAVPGGVPQTEVQTAVDSGAIVGEAINLVRELVNR